MTWIYRLTQIVSWPFYKLFWRFKIIRLAPIPDGPLVLCSNHMHALDCVTLALVTWRQVHYLTKKELLEKKGIVSWYIRSMGSYPVDRDGNDVKAMRYTLTMLKAGKIIGIFPEGHRYNDGTVHEFHPGAALFAMRSEAKLIPVGLYATHRLFAKTRAVVGQEIDLSEYRGKRINSDDIQHVNKILHDRIAELAKMAKES